MPRGSVEIVAERCKGCGLCVDACPGDVLEVSGELNSSGHNYVKAVRPDNCTGCASCGIICPDVVLTVYREKSEKGV